MWLPLDLHLSLPGRACPVPAAPSCPGCRLFPARAWSSGGHSRRKGNLVALELLWALKERERVGPNTRSLRFLPSPGHRTSLLATLNLQTRLRPPVLAEAVSAPAVGPKTVENLTPSPSCQSARCQDPGAASSLIPHPPSLRLHLLTSHRPQVPRDHVPGKGTQGLQAQRRWQLFWRMGFMARRQTIKNDRPCIDGALTECRQGRHSWLVLTGPWGSLLGLGISPSGLFPPEVLSLSRVPRVLTNK